MGVTADMAVNMVDAGRGTLPEDMPPPVTPTVDTLRFALAVRVITSLRGPRAALRALQGAHVIGMAAATGEAVTGEAAIGIHHMDILGSVITAGATAIRTTDIILGDTTLTATGIGRT